MSVPEDPKTPEEATAILDKYMHPELTFCVGDMEGSTRVFPVDFRLRVEPSAAAVQRKISQEILFYVRGGDPSEQERLRGLLAKVTRELRAAVRTARGG